jgi:hypothetical protein
VQKRCILILGIARSGTSALAGALAAAGVPFGDDSKPTDWRNPKGNFEHFTLSKLNQEVLARLGSNWSDARPLPEGWLKRADVRGLMQEISDRIEADFGNLAVFGLKDPRLVPLFPLYQEVFTDLSRAITLVTIERIEAEVLASIRKSGYFHGWYFPWRGRKLYRHYMQQIAALRMAPGSLHVAHVDLLASPEAVLSELLENLRLSEAGLAVNPSAGAQFIDQALFRNRA